MKISDYEIREELARNGTMNVYLAQAPDGRDVVVKALLPSGQVKESQQQAFFREIRITSALRHRNIVEFIDSGVANGLLFCVMEYCNGGTLRELLLQLGRPLNCAEALPLICQVLAGLHYAHTAAIPSKEDPAAIVHGIVHRDIKPENILLHYNAEGQYTVKIADFGLSKAFQLADRYGWTRTGDIGGSLSFLCRQQIVNYKYVKPEVDVWSAVAVLYFLLTGMPPRSGKTLTFNSILTHPPRPIAEHGRDVPPELAGLIDTALDDSGPLRFKSAMEIRNELKRFITP